MALRRMVLACSASVSALGGLALLLVAASTEWFWNSAERSGRDAAPWYAAAGVVLLVAASALVRSALRSHGETTVVKDPEP